MADDHFLSRIRYMFSEVYTIDTTKNPDLCLDPESSQIPTLPALNLDHPSKKKFT